MSELLKTMCFWPGSPFIDARPEALALIESRCGSIDAVTFRRTIATVIEGAGKSALVNLRWQVGLGYSLFEKLTALKRPSLLHELRLNGDEEFEFEPENGKADLLISVGGSWDAVVNASREVSRQLVRLGLQITAINIGNDEFTERDHSGFLDGISNLQDFSPQDFSRTVFVQPEDDDRTAGGTYLVFRKYREDLEMWNDLPDFVQEHFIGRRKESGDFLDNKSEWTTETWGSTPQYAHVRCANPRGLTVGHPDHWKERMYRRGIKFTEKGRDGILHHGLLFIALVRDPEAQFVRIHNTQLLPNSDQKDFLLSSGYIIPVRSGHFFLPASPSHLLSLLDVDNCS